MLYDRTPGLVSVVVTNYNKAGYIEECLDSLKQQTYRSWELIIVDDCSTDSSRKRIEDWLKNRRFRAGCSAVFLPMPRNVGFSGALTAGYFMAKGEFIAVQDADDLSHLERLEKQVAYLQAHPQIGVVGTNYKLMEKNARGEITYTDAKWLKYGEQIKQTYLEGGHCVCHGTLLFRGTVFDRIGGLTRNIKGAEDYEFIARCLTHKVEIENIREVLYYYRSHSDQRSRQFYKNKGGK
ncbi:glycosyltransferase family 2 protein [Paenibacillus pinistramenti]|uniref:glycosyltransferase family 2 protein n=1 Tax=Paenibacillus pinistramenti TaxID=1768003 RepID=UPI001107F911|nr:glycosyltransferase family 2 protein [Paenibacillus pinistramenti]